ncbi:MAG TPA: VOC family protein [Bryobacteraceae bacterium]|nr:VOC family protein [Bryobacteraceae bacterium]
MARITHFEIPANDPEKLTAFYASVFGWTFQKWGDQEYWLARTGEGGPGIDGAVMRRRHPEQPLVNSLTVASVDDAVAAVLANGGSMALPKMAVPGVGWLAYCKDPEGTVFGMMQNDPSAK